MAASHPKGPVPVQEYPIRTPSLRSLAPKDVPKRPRNDKSTLNLFGLSEDNLAPPPLPRIAEPSAVRLLAPPNVNAAPPPLMKKQPVIAVREEVPPAPTRQRPSIAWLAFLVTLLTFGWWVLFRSPSTTPGASATAENSPPAASPASGPEGKPASRSGQAAQGAQVSPPPQPEPQPVAARSVPSNEHRSGAPDTRAPDTKAPDTKTAAAAPARPSARAIQSAGSATSARPATGKSAPAGKTAAPAKSKDRASATSATASGSSASAPFNANAARAALTRAAASASACRQLGDPAGTARVMVTFAPSGRVTSSVLAGGLFSGTRAGGCIAARMRSATVPPFSGGPITVTKSVAIQ